MTIDPSKPVLNISFSGGRTSGYMTKILLEKYKDTHNCVVLFANTGLEDEKTLEFVNNCDKYFGFNTVWVEAVVTPGERKGTTFKVVTFETASRNGEPFEEVIKKYGIPNMTFIHCTRELKMFPMQAYLKSIGYHHKSVPTAIGIRKDEMRRVSARAGIENIIYPLVDEFPTDKQDVIDWWEDQEFDLGIEEWNGNCRGCYKKSYKKLFKQLDDNPNALDWHVDMESKYGNIRPDKGKNIVFYRGYTSASKVIEMWKEDRASSPTQITLGFYEDAGCSESCEVYPTE